MALPYRLFFPLGLILSWIGILYWLLFGLGWTSEYRPAFHAIIQIQGFLICFAAGFLFTAIPRWTETAPASPWTMGIAALSLGGSAFAAWGDHIVASQLAWSVAAGILGVFGWRRFQWPEGRWRLPNAFIHVPVALGIGIAGSLLFMLDGVYGWDGRLQEMGRLIVFQGVFLGLIIGVGGMALPLITRGEPPPDGGTGPKDRRARAGHLLLALGFLVSFGLEAGGSVRVGYGLRAVLSAVALLSGPALHRFPTRPGWNRRLVWLGPWFIPASYTVGALYPEFKIAALHGVFMGGFALTAFAVAAHVVLGHEGADSDQNERAWPVAFYGLLLGGAILPRAAVQMDPSHSMLYLSLTAGAWWTGSLVWAAYLLYHVRHSRTKTESN
jgi:uncharacterized protein involved in response to NO